MRQRIENKEKRIKKKWICSGRPANVSLTPRGKAYAKRVMRAGERSGRCEASRLRYIALLLLTILLASFSACEESAADYYLEVRGVVLSVGGDCDEAVRALGEPNSYQSAPSCAGTGSDELYIYSGFKIFAHRNDSGAVISALELSSDMHGTREGISIGDSAEKVQRIYGEGESFSGGVEYEGENCRLRIYIKKGRVAGVRYGE